MKTKEELDNLLLTLYWHVEHGECKKAIEKLEKDGFDLGWYESVQNRDYLKNQL